MKNCPNCGFLNPAANEECLSCGTLLPDSAALDNPKVIDTHKYRVGSLCLEVKVGKTPGRIFPLTEAVMIIGRKDKETGEVDIDLSSQEEDNFTVSRQHIRCVYKENGFFIEDLNSRNGTCINVPERIAAGQEFAVKPGDVVALGSRIVLKLINGDI